ENAYPRDGTDNLHSIGQEFLLVGVDRLHADTLKIVDRRPKPDAAGNMRRPRFKLAGNGRVNRLLEGHRTDHVPASLIGRHRLYHPGLRIENGDACRAVQLGTGEAIKFAVEFLDIHLEVGHSLGAVDEHGNLAVVCHSDDLPHWGYTAKSIRNMRDGDEFSSGVAEILKLVDQKFSGVVDWDHAHMGGL